jgi:hypothetical protein
MIIDLIRCDKGIEYFIVGINTNKGIRRSQIEGRRLCKQKRPLKKVFFLDGRNKSGSVSRAGTFDPEKPESIKREWWLPPAW